MGATTYPPLFKTTFAPDMEFCFLDKKDSAKRSLASGQNKEPINLRIVECKENEVCRAGIVGMLFPSKFLGMKLG